MVIWGGWGFRRSGSGSSGQRESVLGRTVGRMSRLANWRPRSGQIRPRPRRFLHKYGSFLQDRGLVGFRRNRCERAGAGNPTRASAPSPIPVGGPDLCTGRRPHLSRKRAGPHGTAFVRDDFSRPTRTANGRSVRTWTSSTAAHPDPSDGSVIGARVDQSRATGQIADPPGGGPRFQDREGRTWQNRSSTSTNRAAKLLEFQRQLTLGGGGGSSIFAGAPLEGSDDRQARRDLRTGEPGAQSRRCGFRVAVPPIPCYRKKFPSSATLDPGRRFPIGGKGRPYRPSANTSVKTWLRYQADLEMFRLRGGRRAGSRVIEKSAALSPRKTTILCRMRPGGRVSRAYAADRSRAVREKFWRTGPGSY